MIPLTHRLAIYETSNRYVWSMDTVDIAGAIATFSRDGVVQDVTGKRWDAAAGGAAGFAKHFLTMPNRRGGQHWVQHNKIEKAGNGYVLHSYWHAVCWDVAANRKLIRALGTYVDTFVEEDGRWVISEKIIGRWDSHTAPMAKSA